MGSGGWLGGGEAVPGAAGDGGGSAFWAVAQVVAPSAGWAGTRGEHLVVAAWGQSVAHALVGRRTLRGDALGAAEVPGQRLVGVGPDQDLAGGQMVRSEEHTSELQSLR